jgi:hypothetical protein
MIPNIGRQQLRPGVRQLNQINALSEKKPPYFLFDRLKFVCILGEYNSGWDSSE